MSNVTLVKAIVNFLGKAGDIPKMKEVYRNFVEKNENIRKSTAVWNAMIGG